MRYVIKILFLTFVVVGGGGFMLSGVSADDLLMKAFQPTIDRDLTIDLGETKESVGASITQSRTKYEIDIFKKGKKVEKSKKNPLLVQISKILLKFTAVLSVTMIIYNAILYGVKVAGGDDYKSKESLKKIYSIVFGILLAFSSIALINLIRSLSHSFF